jgi:hypothetical protein
VLSVPEGKAGQVHLESHAPLDRPSVKVRACERFPAGSKHRFVQGHWARAITHRFGLEPFWKAVKISDVSTEPHNLKLLARATPVLHESCKNELDHGTASCVRDLLELIHDHTAYSGENAWATNGQRCELLICHERDIEMLPKEQSVLLSSVSG